MTRPRRRFPRDPGPPLEPRVLLSGVPAAVWLGQDGTDVAGGTAPLAGNGVQDVHVAISGLPADDPIRSLEVIGDGGGEWTVNLQPYSAFTGVLDQAPGSTTADLFLEPYQTETGRKFFLDITYDDGATAFVQFAGGSADPNLWMPADAVGVTWDGQDGRDLTGPGPSVGPDGFQDVHLALSNLYAGSAVDHVTVSDANGDVWQSGTNPNADNNAEFATNASDATRGDLDFSPLGNLGGQALAVTVAYADGKSNTTTLTAGATNPSLPMPAAATTPVVWNVIRPSWVGQDGLDLVGAGDVHVAVSGLPAGRAVASAVLSDEAGMDWEYTAPGASNPAADPSAQPLGLRAGADPSGLDLTFPPGRDETGSTLTLTLVLDDGTTLAARFAGGAADPGLRAPGPAPTSVVASPGDDLQSLANTFGTVRLTAGVYPLSAPLVLDNPVTIEADPGVTLLFAQPAGAAPWTAAIKVTASHTTLEGFAVRFNGPVDWNASVSYGPAVIGTADNLDPPSADPRLDLTFSGLDLQAPPASTSWEEAPELLRLTSASSGVISGNTLKGGSTEFFGGPWDVTGNTYLGTMPDTYTYDAFATHYTHDVTIANNVVAPGATSGKTWRFLVTTESGFGDVVRNNVVVGVGPMDSDTVVNPNAPEVVLTEAYRVEFEGAVASVSADGMVVQIPAPQGGAARTGDVFSILNGPQAGQYRVIAQALGPETYLLDSPVTPGAFDASIATGFVHESYVGNTVDERGSSTADAFVLAGNQFGATVVGNHVLGGLQAFRLTAYPSEWPVTWGWTHAPFLGATVAGNTVVDSLAGVVIDVEHSRYIKTDAGRVYFSGTFTDNTGVWDADGLAARAAAGLSATPGLVNVGNSLSVDPGELVLTASGNAVLGPAGATLGPTFVVDAGTVNGAADRGVSFALPAPRSAVTAYAVPSITLTNPIAFVASIRAESAAERPVSSSPEVVAGPRTSAVSTAAAPVSAAAVSASSSAPVTAGSYPQGPLAAGPSSKAKRVRAKREVLKDGWSRPLRQRPGSGAPARPFAAPRWRVSAR